MTRYVLIAIVAMCAAPGFADENAGNATVTAEAPAAIKNSIGMTLVRIPAGTFLMGSPAREPNRNNNEAEVEVTITAPFLISDTEVTQDQWTEVMGNSPWEGAVNNSFAKKDPRFPAVGVTWDDAVEFCKVLTTSERETGKIPADATYSLPTEAQWEYACRAGSKRAYSYGHDASQLADVAWWGGDIGNGNASSERYAHEVASKQPNAWKLFDMHGNVSEWCQDGFEDKLPGGKDPLAPTRTYARVIRGGGWPDGAPSCRSAARSQDGSASSSYSRGFRVVRTVGTTDETSAEDAK